jgi:hypothetical protein
VSPRRKPRKRDDKKKAPAHGRRFGIFDESNLDYGPKV